MSRPRLRRSSPSLCLCLVLAGGCDSARSTVDASSKSVSEASAEAVETSKKTASELADKASDEATKLSQDAVEASKKAADEAVDATKKAADEAVEATKQGARSLYDDLRPDGELSRTAKAWLAKQATEGNIVSYVNKGVQLAPTAAEASRVLVDAVDSDTAVEPIYQQLGDDTEADLATVDAAIADMPRVEVVEDVTVGFEQLEGFEGTDHVKERGFLVMWRHQDHLVGFVYRSKRRIDLAAVVAETPRIIRMTQQILGG